MDPISRLTVALGPNQLIGTLKTAERLLLRFQDLKEMCPYCP
ncbi:MAG: hypothetical protein ACE5J5_08510 [Candidatus Hydrothermarchaeales archaeon]